MAVVHGTIVIVHCRHVHIRNTISVVFLICRRLIDSKWSLLRWL